ncbi:hypothetical protein SDC9_189599 [bioreactor metagenome]|uniref:Uncharacterized protein n=1 Tax=bioreactor metagenome TaxID=1076179 RepID=A0A645I3I5_9ZZZZ
MNPCFDQHFAQCFGYIHKLRFVDFACCPSADNGGVGEDCADACGERAHWMRQFRGCIRLATLAFLSATVDSIRCFCTRDAAAVRTDDADNFFYLIGVAIVIHDPIPPDETEVVHFRRAAPA